MSLDPLSLDVPILSSLAGAAVDERLLADLRAAGHPQVRHSHGYVIQLLVDDTPTVTEIAARLEVSQQAASKSVADLEELGYVTRGPDPDDQRARRVALTARGHQVVEFSRDLRERLARELEAQVGVEDTNATRRTLNALLNITGARDAVAERRVPLPQD